MIKILLISERQTELYFQVRFENTKFIYHSTYEYKQTVKLLYRPMYGWLPINHIGPRAQAEINWGAGFKGPQRAPPPISTTRTHAHTVGRYYSLLITAILKPFLNKYCYLEQ